MESCVLAFIPPILYNTRENIHMNRYISKRYTKTKDTIDWQYTEGGQLQCQLLLVEDIIFTSHSFAEERQYLHFSIILRPWVLVLTRKSNPRHFALQSSPLQTELQAVVLRRLYCFLIKISYSPVTKSPTQPFFESLCNPQWTLLGVLQDGTKKRLGRVCRRLPVTGNVFYPNPNSQDWSAYISLMN